MIDIKNKVLLCCDLDRTVLPNGDAPESPNVRKKFAKVTRHDAIILVYVSGRNKRLVLQAINDYQIPVPDYAICDVGSLIYKIKGNRWLELDNWSSLIASDWRNCPPEKIIQCLSDIELLTLQEPEKQTRLKVSYYTPLTIDIENLKTNITQNLAQQGYNANLVWSIDDVKHCGLLDILPPQSNKLHAIEFLMKETGFKKENIVFAGDSGNDIPIIISDIPAVLVKNAHESVCLEATKAIKDNGYADFIYIAAGDFSGLNGNYCAGILEGLVHYHPHFADLVKSS